MLHKRNYTHRSSKSAAGAAGSLTGRGVRAEGGRKSAAKPHVRNFLLHAARYTQLVNNKRRERSPIKKLLSLKLRTPEYPCLCVCVCEGVWEKVNIFVVT